MGIHSAKQIIPGAEFTGKVDTSGGGPIKLKVLSKTADYTLTRADSGAIVTNTGATSAVNFTLPSIAESGLFYFVVVTADQTVTVTAATADTLITFNDLAADSIAFSTASTKIGGVIFVVANGSKWTAVNLTDDNTETIAT